MTLKGKLRCVGMTDTGKVREHNEDTIAFDADIGLLVLADGMGGYNAGEVVSGNLLEYAGLFLRSGNNACGSPKPTKPRCWPIKR